MGGMVEIYATAPWVLDVKQIAVQNSVQSALQPAPRMEPNC